MLRLDTLVGSEGRLHNAGNPGVTALFLTGIFAGNSTDSSLQMAFLR